MRKEMAVEREIIRVSTRSPFNSDNNEGAHNGSTVRFTPMVK
jgi:hypothetical protein